MGPNTNAVHGRNIASCVAHHVDHTRKALVLQSPPRPLISMLQGLSAVDVGLQKYCQSTLNTGGEGGSFKTHLLFVVLC